MAATKKTVTAAGTDDKTLVTIHAPNFKIIQIPIRGTSNFVSNAFPQEAMQMMADDMRKGGVDKVRGSKKPPKDFMKGYEGSMHKTREGAIGIPCVAFRAAMVRAAQLCGVEMTRAKMCVFVLPDDVDPDGKGLVLFKKGEPKYFESYVRNSNGSADVRARARFEPGWEAVVSIQFDADFMSASSVANLLARAGVSVGVGAGRPFSTASVGQNWGTFEIDSSRWKQEGEGKKLDAAAE